jgi:hypothetical protein
MYISKHLVKKINHKRYKDWVVCYTYGWWCFGVGALWLGLLIFSGKQEDKKMNLLVSYMFRWKATIWQMHTLATLSHDEENGESKIPCSVTYKTHSQDNYDEDNQSYSSRNSDNNWHRHGVCVIVVDYVCLRCSHNRWQFLQEQAYS